MRRRLAFIGCLAPDLLAEQDPAISQAANLYQRKVISILKPDLTISLLPLSMRPPTTLRDDSDTIYISNDIGLPLLLHRLWRAFADTVTAIIALVRSRANVAAIYNIDKQNVIVLCALLLMPRRRTILIAADNIGTGVGWWHRLSGFLAGRCHAAVVLNSNVRCNRRQMTSPGLIRFAEIHVRNVCIGRKVLLSGSLGRTTGLDLALEAFADMPDFELLICGRPFRCSDDEIRTKVAKSSSKHGNICYLGLVSNVEHARIRNCCDVALSLRNPSESEHDFNFPSKIIEYLADSMIVISTLRYRDIPDYLLVHSPFDASSLTGMIRRIHAMPHNEVLQHRYKVASFLRRQATLESFRRKFDTLAHG